jgi:hypothetical protein
MVHISL